MLRVTDMSWNLCFQPASRFGSRAPIGFDKSRNVSGDVRSNVADV